MFRVRVGIEVSRNWVVTATNRYMCNCKMNNNKEKIMMFIVET